MHTDYHRATVRGMGSQNQQRRYVLAFAHGYMVRVLVRGHAAWKSAHTLRNVCAGFHVMYMYMYIHETGEERKKKYRYHASFVCVRFSKGEGLGRND